MYPCGTTLGFDTALILVPGGIASYGDQAISLPPARLSTIEPSHLSTQTFSPCAPACSASPISSGQPVSIMIEPSVALRRPTCARLGAIESSDRAASRSTRLDAPAAAMP